MQEVNDHHSVLTVVVGGATLGSRVSDSVHTQIPTWSIWSVKQKTTPSKSIY